MTVVVDPAGSPTVIYSKSGTTVSDLVATGTDKASAAQIVRYSEVTVVNVSITAGSQGVILPGDAEIGDVVEIYSAYDAGSFGRESFFVYGSGSDDLAGRGNQLGYVYSWRFRKTRVGYWDIVGNTNGL